MDFLLVALFRFIIYGLMGIAIEVIWTAIYAKLFEGEKGWALKGVTYIWMFPIYGLIVLLYEPTMFIISDLDWYFRGFIYMVGFFGVEYLTGYLLKKWFACPWDYKNVTPLQLHGFIRFDYAPMWFLIGLALEPVSNFLTEISPSVPPAFKNFIGM